MQKYENTTNQIYNLGGPDVLSLDALAKIMIDKYGGKIEYVPFPDISAKTETGDTIFDDTKLLDTGFAYKRNIIDSI